MKRQINTIVQILKVSCLYLYGENLHSYMFVQHLALPDAPKAPPGFYLQQLQGLETQQWGGRGRPRVLGERQETWRVKRTV